MRVYENVRNQVNTRMPASFRRRFIYWLAERLYWELQALSASFNGSDADLSTAIGMWQQSNKDSL